MIPQQYFHHQPHSCDNGYFESGNVNFSEFNYDTSLGDQYAQRAQQMSKQQNEYFTPTPVGSDMAGPFNFDDEPPLLEELGVNFGHIFQKISFKAIPMVSFPCANFCFFTWQTLNVLNPMREGQQEVLEDTDLAGPLVFCLIFGGTLLLAGKVHFNYIYGLGLLGCVGMYILLNLMTPDGVAPTCIVSVLGYCLLPMCALSTIGILVSLKSVFGVVLTAIVVLWCAMSSSKLFVRALNMNQQRCLVGYPCALVYAVFALLTVF